MLSRDNAELIATTERMLEDAFAKGGIADKRGWGVAEADIERTAEAVLDLFIEGIARRPPSAPG